MPKQTARKTVRNQHPEPTAATLPGQKGGIILKTDSEKAFSYFISNSTIDILTEGSSFGIILKATLKPKVKSPYEMFVGTSFRQPVEKILVKLVALSEYKLDPDDAVWPYLNGRTKQIDLEENFIKEVNIQTDIFFKTMEYLEPLCPAPVYSSIIGKNKHTILAFIDILKSKTSNPYTRKVFDIIMIAALDNRIPSLGVLGMEIAEGFQPMANFYGVCENETDPEYMKYYQWTEQMCKLQILNLALKTGYSQNDFHLSNLLVNPLYKGLYKNLKGKTLIIDFGLATKLSDEKLTSIRYYSQQKRFSEALKVFETLRRSDNLQIKTYPTIYGWLYNHKASFKTRPNLPMLRDKDHDQMIGDLRGIEEMAIDVRIKIFDEAHRKRPELYPLLPLSNKIKNMFFQGMMIAESGIHRRRHPSVSKIPFPSMDNLSSSSKKLGRKTVRKSTGTVAHPEQPHSQHHERAYYKDDFDGSPFARLFSSKSLQQNKKYTPDQFVPTTDTGFAQNMNFLKGMAQNKSPQQI
jgi:hypothetical protein